MDKFKFKISKSSIVNKNRLSTCYLVNGMYNNHEIIICLSDLSSITSEEKKGIVLLDCLNKIYDCDKEDVLKTKH
jgi:hypothetical protein